MPFIAVQVQLLCAACRFERWVVTDSVEPCSDFWIYWELKRAVMFQHIACPEQPCETISLSTTKRLIQDNEIHTYMVPP
jgi:hypothetical protein